jgi:hypothetical protein
VKYPDPAPRSTISFALLQVECGDDLVRFLTGVALSVGFGTVLAYGADDGSEE